METPHVKPPVGRETIWLRIGQGAWLLLLADLLIDGARLFPAYSLLPSCPVFPPFYRTKLLFATTSLVIITISWRQAHNPAMEVLRKIAAGTFIFGGAIAPFLSPNTGWPAQTLVYVAFGLLLVLLPRLPPGTLGNFGLAGLSTVFTVVLVGIILELVLRTDYSKMHLFGVYGDWPTPIRPTLNSLGYRDIDHSLSKPPGTVRILVLGDSLTWGEGVADGEVYASLLAQLAGPRTEIINIARRGWSTGDELAALREEGLAYSPDIVIVGVVSNDPAPPSPEPDGEQPEWVCFRFPLVNSDLFRFLDYQLNRLGDQLGLRYSYTAWENDLYNPGKPYWSEWQQTVRDFGNLVESRHIPTYAVMLVQNNQGQVTERKYALMTQEFARDGFITLDLWDDYTREFGNIPYKKLWALPNNGHPGPALQAFYAREIWRVLQPEVQSLQSKLTSN